MRLDHIRALAAYEAARHRLPKADGLGRMERVENLDAISDQFDVFLLDAFGVLNIGDTPIPGVADRITGLRRLDKRVLVITNAATQSLPAIQAKYQRMGFDIPIDDVVTSRSALLAAAGGGADQQWGVMGSLTATYEDLAGFSYTLLGEDPDSYESADAFLLLGSADWSDAQQNLLESSLQQRLRPMWVGNPDIVAPRERHFSVEPGFYAHQAADRTGVEPQFFGKPFRNVYDLAFAKLDPQVSRERVVMVGDSLHTDILGAQAAGIASALIEDFGFFAGFGATDAINQTGIRPDFILKRP